MKKINLAKNIIWKGEIKVKTHQIVHSKHVPLFVYQLYLTKAVCFKKGRQTSSQNDQDKKKKKH